MASKRKHSIPTKECRATSPDPHDHDEESYSVRNGDMRDELSPGEEIWPGYAATKKCTPPGPRELSSPVILQDTGSVHDETSSSGNKEDDDDDDEDVDDLKTLPHDPERLKAFNMFVRLFVDENLDRIVPISKQPKEKIQAIIDSCTRQFPEFAERARKRIRTYLKSCRRNKRTRDPTNYPESVRPTPAHLTSVQAEQILAQACENESHNAKRMRLGLEPVSQPMPIIPASEPVTTRATMDHPHAHPHALSHHQQHQFSPIDTKVAQSSIISNNNNINNNNNNKSDSPIMGHKAEQVQTSHQHLINSQSISSHSPMNGSPLFRQASQVAFARGGQAPFGFGATPFAHSTPAPIIANGPTDLSMKQQQQQQGPSQGIKGPLVSHRLNPTEMAAVRQLITGYRESAAFLLRSADELEQLLLQQP
ncbi:nucleolar protein 4 isoform X2 [Nilaparvata lugens]|uniref:nucleolar protein 4 isoform X2 n=1 Tax=Nilaparvata lugens TaxID=108931 RepID=UPI00193CA734|nr:nucleolar protein 4 isoform X2 [Nilaparvata lugens]XP_039298260.1 nucleolar protein 4 isoform X2 [Nilaparvata lugens]XP_039298261.1 nucleolar protein 4 isoform X2 [Nilaparvata lugens]XP_039298262.1 nucleolar protein 4 isoform X2 [Nilaparvata lugens]